jgi:dCMP deaminase
MSDKIEYDDYFLTMCFLVAQRSPDPSTKCGAVLVSSENKVLSTGYNGPIKGSDDSLIPLERPAKYAHLLHAEENCLLAYNGSFQDIVGSTMYVTGRPCHRCLRMILQKGVKRIVTTDGNKAVMQDDSEAKIYELMLSYTKGIEMIVLPNLPDIINLLRKTEKYIVEKNPHI